MQHNTKQAYRELFHSIDSRSLELDCPPDPATVVSDFDHSAMFDTEFDRTS